MSFAIIETGGKQYKVSASNILKIEKLDIKKGNKVEFKKVLLVNDDKTVEIGREEINKNRIYIKFGCNEDKSHKTSISSKSIK